MVHIRKQKTFSGELVYTVVDVHVAITKDENNNMVKTESYLPVTYKQSQEVLTAVFPHTAEGLEEAREVQALYKRKK